ncbi:Uncharacterised protein [Sphingobacterium spiritivorum]|uniref:Uncharacterized protein n=1 Tax=Sphingobacterium spiritivorum TaxID=258 RepID=A0A380B8S7_SPHSI|nr:hypothetical protein [Sphingobacterium spiritivorum]SUI96906.1 Uncharacterised protein [Sphingobacterium spiritivorum]
MTVSEFEYNLQIIRQTLFSIRLTEDRDRAGTYVDALYSFNKALSDNSYPFLAYLEDTIDSIEFSIYGRNADLFMLRKNELESDKDPIPYIKGKREWESYEFTLSAILLTEYTDWLSEQAEYKFELQLSGYGIYVPVKKYWNQFFNPFSYPNKIWLGKDHKSVLYIQNESNMLKCVANNTEDLRFAEEVLGNN